MEGGYKQESIPTEDIEALVAEGPEGLLAQLGLEGTPRRIAFATALIGGLNGGLSACTVETAGVRGGDFLRLQSPTEYCAEVEGRMSRRERGSDTQIYQTNEGRAEVRGIIGEDGEVEATVMIKYADGRILSVDCSDV